MNTVHGDGAGPTTPHPNQSNLTSRKGLSVPSPYVAFRLVAVNRNATNVGNKLQNTE
jgi:hypothetical protein